MDPPASFLQEMPHLCKGITGIDEKSAAKIISAVVRALKAIERRQATGLNLMKHPSEWVKPVKKGVKGAVSRINSGLKP